MDSRYTFVFYSVILIICYNRPWVHNERGEWPSANSQENFKGGVLPNNTTLLFRPNINVSPCLLIVNTLIQSYYNDYNI